MAYTEKELAKELENKKYEYGFTTDVESDVIKKGLNEEVVRLISSKKNEMINDLIFHISLRNLTFICNTVSHKLPKS